MNEKRDVEGLYNRYRQVPLYLIGMFCLMTVFMYFVGIGAGVIATIFTAVYGAVSIVVFLRMNALSATDMWNLPWSTARCRRSS